MFARITIFSPYVSGVFCWVCTFLKRSLFPFFFFLLKKVSRCSYRLAEASANCCCRLVNKFIFAWEWHIWPRAEILGVCGPCESWQILSWKKIAFGSVINFIFIFVAGRTSQSLIFFFFLNWWSSVISQSCDSSGAAEKRWWGSGQFIYDLSLLHLSSCKRGELVYEAHWNFMDHSLQFRVAWLTCRVWVWCFISCIFIHKTCKSKLQGQQKLQGLISLILIFSPVWSVGHLFFWVGFRSWKL